MDAPQRGESGHSYSTDYELIEEQEEEEGYFRTERKSGGRRRKVDRQVINDTEKRDRRMGKYKAGSRRIWYVFLN